MIRRILLGLGGTRFTPSAIQHAIELARRHQATITGVTVVDVDTLGSVGPLPLGGGCWGDDLKKHRLRVAREEVERAVRELSTACEANKVALEVRREEGDPFSLLTSDARYHDLMLFGLKSLFEYDLVPEPHDALVRLVSGGVRPLVAVASEYREIRRAVIAYSGSMESAKTMRRFLQLPLWPDATIRIVTFWQHGSVQEAESLVRDAATYCQAHGFVPETDCVHGAAKSELLPYAEQWGADLIVLGNSARSLLMRRIFGDTALNVIEHADRPLFLCQ